MVSIQGSCVKPRPWPRFQETLDAVSPQKILPYICPMTLRPPRVVPRPAKPAPSDALAYEIAQEQATALGRLGRRLEAALAALAEFDHAHAPAERRGNAARHALVDAASDSLWQFIVQREACGLRDSARVLRDYGVPAEVQMRMGAGPRSL
jgi:hypothetical protein